MLTKDLFFFLHTDEAHNGGEIDQSSDFQVIISSGISKFVS